MPCDIPRSGKPQSLFAKTVGKKVQAQQQGQREQQGHVERVPKAQEAGQCERQVEREDGGREGVGEQNWG